MICLLHIPNLHFLKSNLIDNVGKIICNEAAEKVKSLRREEKLLVITGDFHDFQDSDYQKAEQFIYMLVTAMGIDITQDVFVIPGIQDEGNENALKSYLCPLDEDWKQHNKADVLMLKGGHLEFITERLRAFRPYSAFVQRLGIYNISLGEDYPATTHVRGWRDKLNVLHLNTALCADGIEKVNQMVDTASAASEETWSGYSNCAIPAIAIGHNNFYDLKEEHRRDLATTFSLRNVSAYLCGDNHLTEKNPERQMIRLESGHIRGVEIPNLVAARGIADGDDTYSEVGYCWHYWNENTNEVTVEFRKWTRDSLAKTENNGDLGKYIMISKKPEGIGDQEPDERTTHRSENDEKPCELHLDIREGPHEEDDAALLVDATKKSNAIRFSSPAQLEKVLPDVRKYNQQLALFASLREQVQSGKKYVKFGFYPQDSNGGSQPIEWLVLFKDTTRCLLISRFVLDCRPYHDCITEESWDSCQLHHWLNTEFISKAFSKEKSRAVSCANRYTTQKAINSPSSTTLTETCISLLSVSEAETFFSSNNDRQCLPTGFAIKNGVWENNDWKVDGRGVCLWWMRNSGANSFCAPFISYDGSIGYEGLHVNLDYVGIRPAFWLNI